MINIRVIRHELPEELNVLEIHTFADLHFGDRFADIELIKQHIAEVKEKRNAYVILNGDLLNNATKTSISDNYAEELTPMEQIQFAVDLFEPIKDKILCINTGNHEKRTYNKEGIDLTEVIARQMGLYHVFSTTSSYIFLRFGQNNKGRKSCYTIYAIHGSGGGRREGGKVNRLADMASIIDADIYIHSHTHLPIIMKQGFFRVSPANSSVSHVDKLFVNTSAALNYGGYGEAFEYKPSSKDNPIIYLNGNKKEMSALL